MLKMTIQQTRKIFAFPSQLPSIMTINIQPDQLAIISKTAKLNKQRKQRIRLLKPKQRNSRPTNKTVIWSVIIDQLVGLQVVE